MCKISDEMFKTKLFNCEMRKNEIKDVCMTMKAYKTDRI